MSVKFTPTYAKPQLFAKNNRVFLTAVLRVGRGVMELKSKIK